MKLGRGTYLVTPDWDDTDKLLQVSEQALMGGAVVLQYRHKTAAPAQALEQAGALLKLCRRYQTPLIVNDNVALCIAIDADGVHVGGTDAAVGAVRAELGGDKIVGASCYGSLTLAQQSAAAGASYVAFGGFYPSQVKQYEVGTPPELIARAKALLSGGTAALPIVVIGGMTVENAAPLVAQGADLVAVISSVYNATDPQAAARRFTELFAE